MAKTRKIGILQVLQEYGSSIAYVSNEYARSLDRNRYRITVVYLFGRPAPLIEHDTSADEVLFLDLPEREPYGLRIQALRRLLTLCRRGQFDLVVCHRYKPAHLMALVGLFCPIHRRLLYVVHGVRALGVLARLRRRLYAAVLFRRRFVFIAVSNDVGKDLLASRIPGKRDLVLTIHNSLDVDAVVAGQLDRGAARRLLGLDPATFVFGIVGRLASYKGQDLLIRALALAREELGDAKLAIIGSGKAKAQLRELAKSEGVANRVVFCGHVAHAARVMTAFDVFVLASAKEPFGLVLLEAMAARTPIIASTTGGALEVIEGCARPVADRSPEGFAAAMRFLYQLPPGKRKSLGEEGFRHLRRNFSRSRFADALADLGIDVGNAQRPNPS
jgi:glycosyltransferase involved in cell wall biosynthesis